MTLVSEIQHADKKKIDLIKASTFLCQYKNSLHGY